MVNIDGRIVDENWFDKEFENMTDDELLATLDVYYDSEEETILDSLDEIIDLIEEIDDRYIIDTWRAYLNESKQYDFEYNGKIYLHDKITARELKSIVADVWEDLENR